MSGITYTEVIDDSKRLKVRRKFQSQIDFLESQGFEELCLYTETTQPFGCFLTFPALILDVARLKGLFQISIYQLLFIHKKWFTYTNIFGLGTKFCTVFQDQTIFVSANFVVSSKSELETEKFYKIYKQQSLEKAWQFHQEFIQELQKRENLSLSSTMNFEQYMTINQIEDERMKSF